MLDLKTIQNSDVKKTIEKYQANFIKKDYFSYLLRLCKMLRGELIFFFNKKKYKEQSIGRKIAYDKHWQFFKLKSHVWHSYKGNYFLSSGSLTQEIFINLIKSQLNDKSIKSVLEVGCGNGLNIFPLAKDFPEVKFTGVDISSTGITFCKDKLNSLNEYKNLSFLEGNAKNLTFPANSFDLTYTVLALEQMNQIKTQVIENIKRVTSNKIVFIEPFKDVNKSLINKIHMINSDYLNLSYNELDTSGYKISHIMEDFPQRVGLAASCLVLTKVNL